MSRILVSYSLIDDDKSMSTVISLIKNAEGLHERLVKRPETGCTQAYDAKIRTARYVVSDGKIVACFTLTDVSPEQAAEVAAETDSIAQWNLREFQAVVERVLSRGG
jgi:hypothetical protein